MTLCSSFLSKLVEVLVLGKLSETPCFSWTGTDLTLPLPVLLKKSSTTCVQTLLDYDMFDQWPPWIQWRSISSKTQYFYPSRACPGYCRREFGEPCENRLLLVGAPVLHPNISARHLIFAFISLTNSPLFITVSKNQYNSGFVITDAKVLSGWIIFFVSL